MERELSAEVVRHPKTVDELIETLYDPRMSGRLPSYIVSSSPKTEGAIVEPSTPAFREPTALEDCTLDSRLNIRKFPAEEGEEQSEEAGGARLTWRKEPTAEVEELLLPGLRPPQLKVIRQYDISDDDYSTQSDEPKRKTWMITPRVKHDDVNKYSKDYWLARKKIKILRMGNELAVVNTLNIMSKMDYDQQDLLYGVVDSGGLETLLNILDHRGSNTQLNALRLLNKMANYEFVKGMMVNQGIPESCLRLLSSENLSSVLEASTILLKLAPLPAMRAAMRKSKGLEILLEFADMKESWLSLEKPLKQLKGSEREAYQVSANCLKCLVALYASRGVRRNLYRLGFLALLRRLLRSVSPDFYKMGVDMIVRAASLTEYVEVFIEEGLMDFIYKKYTGGTHHLEWLRVVTKCLENKNCKQWMLERGLFNFLMEEFQSKGTKELKYTMACIVKFANIEKYRHIFDSHQPIQKLFLLFDHPSPKIRDYAGYLMGQLSRYPKNFPEIDGSQSLGTLKLLEYVQTNTDYTLVAHLYKVLCDLSFDDRIYWDICDVTDPIGILWGSVTADHPKIHEYGCSALVPYIGPMPDSVERVLRFPGALHDLLTISRHEDDGAKAGAITLLARLCQVGLFPTLIGEGFDNRLLELGKTASHPRLRYAIGYGLGACARTDEMSFSLGKRGAVQLLLDWLVADDDRYALLGIVTGLWKLSFEPINCKTIIQANVATRLTGLTTGKNECLQNSLAGLLSNMRELARSAECLRNRQRAASPLPGRASDPDIIAPFQYADDPAI